MLGQLFSKGTSFLPLGGSPNPSRPSTSLESVQEDIHTWNLLFPDAETLYEHQHDQVFPLASSTVPLLTSSLNAFDINPEVDLDLKDVRVVIMQEATSIQHSAALLFDSHSPTEAPQSPVSGPSQTRGSGTGTGRSITSPRRISLGQASKPVIITQESAPRTFGAFDRRPSGHARTGSYAETEGQRAAREYREEMTTFSNCIFGSSDIMAYKGTGMKVHIIPTESKASSYPFDGHGSLGRSSIKSSKLAQSYTSDNITTPVSAGLPSSGSSIRVIEKKKVLITRIFPVPLPNTDSEDGNSLTPTQSSNGPGSYPFTDVGGKVHGRKPKQKRTPMYAIGLIVQLPAATQMPSIPISRSGFRPSSYTDQESFASSYSSLKPSGWTVLGLDSLDSSYSDIDDRIDGITQHWDIITRTLSRLQAVVSDSVLTLLKQVDAASPNPVKINGNVPMKVPSAGVSISGKRVETTFKPHRLAGTNAKIVQLTPNALVYHQKTKTEADNARHRIVSGIKAQQVITRQGRWGIWREEARWVAKWAGGKEEAFFFYNLLTSFLGVHTDWMQAIGPIPYRKQYYQQHRTTKEEEVPIAARTILVAQDKMSARRLLFLLSAFLPPKQQHQATLTRIHRPSTSTSFGAYSQSPPTYVPVIVREESLRRKVNRKNGSTRGGHLRTISISQSVHDNHERPNSDVIALTTANLPIPGSEGGNGGSRKSSAATTTTVLPTTTIPHFSTRRPIRGTGPIPRPGSSGSLATDDLIRSLKRGDSSGHYSNSSSEQGYSRWGSMISTLWNNKRRDSTNETDITVSSLSDGSAEAISPSKKERKERGKLAEMVEEAHRQNVASGPHGDHKRKQSISYSLPEVPKDTAASEQSRPTPPFEQPIRNTVVGVDEDGCIDIDVPLPPFLSFGSTFSSPSSSGYLSGGGMGMGFEGFEQYTGNGEAESSTNVAGWLPRYHPDFTLQAIPSQEQSRNTLEEEIKESMRAEPTPQQGPWREGESNRWITISTSLIADTTNWTIKRIQYRRHVAPKMIAGSTSSEIPDTLSMYGNPYDSISTAGKDDSGYRILGDEFQSDVCVYVDDRLVAAVEKAVAWPETASSKISSVSHSATPSNGEGSQSSRGTSRERSRERRRESSDATVVPTPSKFQETHSENGTPVAGTRPASLNLSLKVPEAKLEVPRGEVKSLLLGALAEVALEVAESREHEAEVEAVVVEHEREKENFLREGVREWLVRVENW